MTFNELVNAGHLLVGLGFGLGINGGLATLAEGNLDLLETASLAVDDGEAFSVTRPGCNATFGIKGARTYCCIRTKGVVVGRESEDGFGDVVASVSPELIYQ